MSDLKISICIPQYNRAAILMKNLERIQLQSYSHIEVVISDDVSTDDTVQRVQELAKEYKFPIILNVNESNQGYDRNYRKSIELSSGDYALVLGNDDSLFHSNAIQNLVTFLTAHGFPDIGYCNYIEEGKEETIIERAESTKVHGSGFEVAMKYYNGFSFVAGIIYKKSQFEKFNSGKHDGSIYAQMYLGLLMIASGCTFFTIKEPLVVKDISDECGNKAVESYKNKLARKWSEFKSGDGGLPSVSNVLISALQDATHRKDPNLAYRILKRVYGITFPYWLIQYKRYGSIYASLGLIHGLYPPSTMNWDKVNSWGKTKLMFVYTYSSVAGLLFPASLFEKMEHKLRRFSKRSHSKTDRTS